VKSFERIIVGLYLVIGASLGLPATTKARFGDKNDLPAAVRAGASALVGDVFGGRDQDSDFSDPAREFYMQQDPDMISGADNGLASNITSTLNRDKDHVNIFISVPISGNKTQNNKKKKKQDSQDQDAGDNGDAPDGADQDGGPSAHESSCSPSEHASSSLDTCEKLGQALTGESSTQVFWQSIVKGNSEYKKAAQKAGALLYRASQVGGAFILMGNMVLAHQNSKNMQSQRDMYTPSAPGASQYDTSMLLMSVIQAAALPSAIALLNSAFQGCK
jgi:hypothetical protein